MPAEGNILHVEDDEAMQRFVAAALGDGGFLVDTVTNGVDAIALIRANPRGYDLVVLDLVLPWVNGLDVLATIRADTVTRHLPVLVTTGTMVTHNQFSGDPRVSVLRKPFEDGQLIAGVKMALHAARFGGTV